MNSSHFWVSFVLKAGYPANVIESFFGEVRGDEKRDTQLKTAFLEGCGSDLMI